MSIENKQDNITASFFYLGSEGVNKSTHDKLLSGFIQADRIMLYLVCCYWLILSTLGGVSNGYYLLGYLGGGLALLIGVIGYIYFKGTYINRILIGCVACIVEVIYIQQELGSPTSHLIYFMSLGFLLLYRDGFAAVASLSLVMLHHLSATYCESIGIEVAGIPILAFNWGRWDAYATHLYWAIVMAVLLCFVTYNSMLEFMRSEKAILDMEKLNRNLDLLVHKRKALLRKKSSEIKEIFSNISEGVLVICQDKTIDIEYSDYSTQILNTDIIAGRNAVSVLFDNTDVSEQRKQQLEQTLVQCFGKTITAFEQQSALLIYECTKQGIKGVRDLELVWHPIVDDNNHVNKVLVNVRDKTEINKLQQQSDNKNRELAMVSELLAINDTEFFDFFAIASAFLTKIKMLLAEETAIDKVSMVMSRVQTQLETLINDPVCSMLKEFRKKVLETQKYSELWQDIEKFEIEHLNLTLDNLLSELSSYEKASSKYLSWERPKSQTYNKLVISKKQILSILSAIDNIDNLTFIQRKVLLNDLVQYLTEVQAED